MILGFVQKRGIADCFYLNIVLVVFAVMILRRFAPVVCGRNFAACAALLPLGYADRPKD